jgi:chorismate dehydratase
MLDSGIAQAVMVSSFDALRSPGRRIADAGSVATQGRVDSVRLFSKVPFEAITTLALDTSSLTSAHLAQVLLVERYGIRPATVDCAPDLQSMLSQCDACVIIGDKGMLADGTGLHVMDLGLEWHGLTGLPFVWAAWIGNSSLDEALAEHLARARDWGVRHIELVARQTQAAVNWPGDSCREYLVSTMDYRLGAEHLAGLREFQRLLLKHGFLTVEHFPEVVHPGVAAS